MSKKSTWDDPRITAYVLGELSGDDLQTFETQLSEQPELAAAVDDARRVTAALEGLFADESTPPLDPQRRDAIAAQSSPATPAASTTTVASKRRRSLVPWIVLATAAVMVLLIGLAPLLTRYDIRTLSQTPDAATGVRAQPLEGYQRVDSRPYGEASELADFADESEQVAVRLEEEAALEYRYSQNGAAVDKLSVERLSQTAPAQPTQPARGGRLGETMAEEELPRLQKPAAIAELRSEAITAAAPVTAAPVAAAPAGPAPAPVAAPAAETMRRKLITPVPSDGKVASRFAGQPADSEVNPSELYFSSPPTSDLQTQLYSLSPKDGSEAAGMGMRMDAEMDMMMRTDAEMESLEVAGPMGMESRDMGMAMGIGGMAGKADVALGAVPTQTTATITLGRELKKQIGVNEYAQPIPEGRGPGIAGDRFDPITDNPFKRVDEHPLSTFSVDVDTASYSKTRDFLMRANQLPRPDAVRIEELINYFDYDYQGPANDAPHPFAADTVITSCPWNPDHRLARIAIQGKTMAKEDRPPCNLVFLLDTSGSMNAPNKLPLVIEGMKMLVKQLSDDDRVAITVYAGSAGLVLDSTPAKKGKKIRKALTQLSAGGSTNGGAGIALAYQTARDHFIDDGVNRVILCTDGDFNVGTTGTDALVRMVEQEAKGGVFLSVLGFGMGNHNDSMLEQISGRGNGNYAFIDTEAEARKVLVDQTSATLVTIAKDVKLQIEFNPAQVSSYRLIGYENRVLAKEDFNDDKKDAGEIGAGHQVTALYEIVPAGQEADASAPKVDDLKYQTKPQTTEAADSEETMTLKLRYKQPDGDTSTLVEFPVTDDGTAFDAADDDVRFAAAVAGFGMQLRRSEYAGTWTLSDVLNVAQAAGGEDTAGLRAEFVQLVRKASELMGQQ